VKVLGAGAIASAGKETIADVMTAVPLSQEWNFQIDPENKGIKERWFDPAFKPEGWATVRSDRKDGLGWEAQEFGGKDGKGYTGYGWYRAELPKLPDKTRTFAYLYFPMADEQAWVYLNGQVVGEHTEKSEGRTYDAIWDQPFAVDVTKHHKKDGPNLLAVRVHNAALNGGLREPVVLIFSDRPTDTTELVRAVPALTKKK